MEQVKNVGVRRIFALSLCARGYAMRRYTLYKTAPRFLNSIIVMALRDMKLQFMDPFLCHGSFF